MIWLIVECPFSLLFLLISFQSYQLLFKWFQFLFISSLLDLFLFKTPLLRSPLNNKSSLNEEGPILGCGISADYNQPMGKKRWITPLLGPRLLLLTPTWVYTCTHTYTYTYTHMYTHIHTHTLPRGVRKYVLLVIFLYYQVNSLCWTYFLLFKIKLHLFIDFFWLLLPFIFFL